MFTIDDLEKKSRNDSVVYFSSEMCSFKGFYEVEHYKNDIDVTVRRHAYAVLDSDGTDDGEVLLAVELDKKMINEISKIITERLK